ncbi:MAG: hypothetical protein GX800_13030 [Clostridiaceae bacterium]|jgi:hypothetical protein|nr:hypothetical protein [Clostridiaceae bacterium]
MKNLAHVMAFLQGAGNRPDEDNEEIIRQEEKQLFEVTKSTLCGDNAVKVSTFLEFVGAEYDLGYLDGLKAGASLMVELFTEHPLKYRNFGEAVTSKTRKGGAAV